MSGAPLPAVLIEAFSERPGAGNGAAVVLLDEPADDPWMQQLAGGLKQSETAFLLPWRGAWLLRWFTPGCEVPLCGHATLAALLALAHWGRLEPGAALALESRSGPLRVALPATGQGQGQLDLPASALLQQTPPPALQALLAERLGLAAEAFWGSALGYHVALLPAAAPLAAMACLAGALPEGLRSGLVLMQELPAASEARPQVGGEPADYQLRFFAPGLGIAEDPVTGSAHALVAPWWQQRLQRGRVVGWQCSDRPGGMVCEGLPSGMIRLTGTGSLLWDGTLQARPQPWRQGLGPGCAAPPPAWFGWHALACAAADRIQC